MEVLNEREELKGRIVQKLAQNTANVLLLGEVGLGKSTLAGEAARMYAASHEPKWTYIYIEATVATRHDPRSVFQPLLSGDQLNSEVTAGLLTRKLISVLTEPDLARGSDNPDEECGKSRSSVILHVDNLHLLNSVSADVLSRLMEQDGIRIIATSRTRVLLPQPFQEQIARGRLQQLEVPRLDFASATELMKQMCQPYGIESKTARRLDAITDGNPLYIRLLVSSLRDNGQLRLRRNRMVLETQFEMPSAVTDLVRGDFATLNKEEWQSLVYVALAEPLEAVLAAKLIPDEAAKTLLERGVVRWQFQAGREASLRVTHPLYAETVRVSLTPSSRAESFQTLFESASELLAAQQNPATLLKAVLWGLECSATLPVDWLVAVHRSVRQLGDGELSQRITTALLDSELGDDSLRVIALADRAEARWRDGLPAFQTPDEESCGSRSESTAVANAAQLAADVMSDIREAHRLVESVGLENISTEALVRLGVASAEAEFFLSDSPVGAVQACNLAREQITGREGAERYDFILALRSGLLGNVGDARAALPYMRMMFHSEEPDRDLLPIAPSYANILGQRGESRESVEFVEQWLRTAEMNTDLYPREPNYLLAAAIGAAAICGDMPNLDRYERLLNTQVQRLQIDSSTTELLLGTIRLTQGQHADAAQHFSDSVLQLEGRDRVGLRRFTLSYLALAYSVSGQPKLALKAREELREQQMQASRVMEAQMNYHIALSAAWNGEDKALDYAKTVVSCSARAGFPLMELRGIHLMAYLEPKVCNTRSLERAQILFAETDAPIANILMRHIAQMCSNREETFDDSHIRLLSRHGLWLPPIAPDKKLTAREVEVAHLAALGYSSRFIATSLWLSIRTVEAHLSSIYRKLNVCSREELSVLMF